MSVQFPLLDFMLHEGQAQGWLVITAQSVMNIDGVELDELTSD